MAKRHDYKAELAAAKEKLAAARAQLAAARLLSAVRERGKADALEQLTHTLEARVRERTAEAERRAAQLRALAAELGQAEHKERRRLAQVLHDGLQQLLAAAKLHVALARRRLSDSGAQAALDQVQALLGEAIETSRSLTAELSPPVLHERGLAAALHWLARQMEEKQKLRVTVRAEAADEPAGEGLGVLLFGAARELLFNAAKHAGVAEAAVTLERVGERVRLVVSDAGKGFDPAAARAAAEEGHFGLFSVAERLALLGGRLDVDSAPGKGARITLLAPGGAAEAAAAPDAEGAAGPVAGGAGGGGGGSGGESGGGGGGGSGGGTRKVRIVLADDHKIVRDGIVALLNGHPDLEVVAQAADGEMAVELARAHQPDVVVMDVSMPKVDGIEATRRILAAAPEVRVIGLSMHNRADIAAALRAAGAVGYVCKDEPIEELVALVRAGAGRSGGRPGK